MESTTVKRRALDLASITGVLLLGAAVHAQERAVQRQALEAHVRVLSADELAGRGNGSTGLETAARYIADQFEVLSLLPAGEQGTYFQRFRLSVGQRVDRDTQAFVRSPLETRMLDYPEDFEVLTFSPERRAAGSLTFAGYGITATERGYDDYEGIDVGGRIVLLLRYAPESFGARGWHATFVRKAMNAASHGAVAVLLVNGPSDEDELVPFGVDVGAESAPIPVLHLKRARAEALLRAAGRDLDTLQKEIDREHEPASFALDDVEMAISVSLQEQSIEIDNVLGYLPPTRESGFGGEHLVIGAHYDHVGLGEEGGRDRRARGKIHNGADDNASGVAGMLELARMFSAAPHRPRGILFAAFAGEELGLRGSAYYVHNPTVPLDRAVAMINLDMIGRLRHDRIFLGGLEAVPGLEPELERRLARAGLTSSGRFSAEAASDHASFIRAGVPAIFLFTGLHGDYHKPTDDFEFINFAGMERVLRVSYEISEHVLGMMERPSLVAAKAKLYFAEPRRPAGGEPAYFGIGVDNSFEGDGVRFAYVAQDGPAAKAGLLPGDVLLEIDGRAVSSSDTATELMRKLRPGEMVSATVRRDGKLLQVKIRLANWP